MKTTFLVLAALALATPAIADMPKDMPPAGSCGDMVASSALAGAAGQSCGFDHTPTQEALVCKTKMQDKEWVHWLTYGAAAYSKVEQNIGHDAACNRVIRLITNATPIVPQHSAKEVCLSGNFGRGVIEVNPKCLVMEQIALDHVRYLWPIVDDQVKAACLRKLDEYHLNPIDGGAHNAEEMKTWWVYLGYTQLDNCLTQDGQQAITQYEQRHSQHELE
jgi:hypothetical protein